MQELVPVLFAFAIATVSSDKFRLNWAHMLLDLGGAAFGVALAFAFVQVLERAKRRVHARELR